MVERDGTGAWDDPQSFVSFCDETASALGAAPMSARLLRCVSLLLVFLSMFLLYFLAMLVERQVVGGSSLTGFIVSIRTNDMRFLVMAALAMPLTWLLTVMLCRRLTPPGLPLECTWLLAAVAAPTLVSWFLSNRLFTSDEPYALVYGGIPIALAAVLFVVAILLARLAWARQV